MKTIEENKVKALFMAQYLGQAVVSHPCDVCLFTLTEISLLDQEAGVWGDWSGGTNPNMSCNDLLGIGDVTLQLRSVSDLTDEEAIQVSKLEYGIFECSGVTFKVSKNLKKHKLVHVLKGGEHWHTFEVSIWPLHIVAIQYLLRIGMLLPFTYIGETGAPITLSTEEIIQKGWVKTHNQL